MGPHDAGHVVAAGALERGQLVVIQVLAGQLDERSRPVEVVQQLGRGEHRPHPLQRLADLGRQAQPLAHLLGRRGRAADLGQGREQLRLHEAAAGVVQPEPAAGVGHDGGRALGRHHQRLQPERHPQRLPQPPLAITHRLGEHRRHASVALDAGGRRAVVAADPDVVDQIGQHRQLDTRLAQAGQHPLDVAEEQPVGPYHQNALALEREPVGVEQVGGPVEGDDGLAGTGTTLDHEHPGQLGADDLVLLGLDGGDDVAEVTGAGFLQGGDQRAVAPDLVRLVPVVVAVVDHTELAVEHPRTLAEQLVLDAEQLPAPGGEVAATHQSHRRPPGGSVEGLGHRRPPVDHEGLLALVGDRHTADVEGVAPVGAGLVDAPEHQAGIAQVQVVETVGDVALDDLPLPAGLLGATLPNLDHRPQLGSRLPSTLQAVVGTIDVRLFGGQVGVGGQSLLRWSKNGPCYRFGPILWRPSARAGRRRGHR